MPRRPSRAGTWPRRLTAESRLGAAVAVKSGTAETPKDHYPVAREHSLPAWTAFQPPKLTPHQLGLVNQVRHTHRNSSPIRQPAHIRQVGVCPIDDDPSGLADHWKHVEVGAGRKVRPEVIRGGDRRGLRHHRDGPLFRGNVLCRDRREQVRTQRSEEGRATERSDKNVTGLPFASVGGR